MRKRVALVAHDNKKEEMIAFINEHKKIFETHELFATGTTGSLLIKNLGLEVDCMLSGPLGGDQQIGAMVALGKLDALIFLRDPLLVMPHEPDIAALLRVCDVHNVPVATNVASARYIVAMLDNDKEN